MRSRESNDIMMGSSPNEQSAAEHEVLCEMNADFHRSKVELIHRFLSDQEELNKRFAEYALNTDDESSENEGNDGDRGHHRDVLSQQLKAKPPTLTEEDILQDLECRSVLDDDNLSTASAINSSLDAGSDIAVLEEDQIFPSDFHLPREGTFIVKDQNGNFSGNRANRYGIVSKARGQFWQADPSPTRTARKDGNSSRKPRKVLVKKNVRPQTAAGIRRGGNLQDETDILQQRLEEEQTRVAISRQESPISMALPHGYTQQHPGSGTSQLSATRMRTSWLEGQQDPEYRQLSGSSTGKHRHSQVASLSNNRSVFMDRAMGYETSPVHVAKSVQIYPSADYGIRQKSGTRSRNIPGSGLLSIDISPNKGRIDSGMMPGRDIPFLGDRDFMDGRSSACSNRSDRNLYSAGRKMYSNQPHLSDVPSTKRKITVLKLPPLEGSVTVNKSILDKGRIVGGAPKGSVTPATEFMAG